MNVTLPKKEKTSKKNKTIYIVVIIIGIISLITVISIEVLTNRGAANLIDSSVAEEKGYGNKTQEEKEALQAEASNKFSNSIEKKSVTTDVKKIDFLQDLVYTNTQINEKKEGSYDIEVALPYINIDSEIARKYNEEIEKLFKEKANSVLSSENKNIIYKTEYVASITGNHLSLMIRATLKEGSSAQRKIVQTYNYDIKENKELSLEDVIKNNNLDKNIIQNEIKNEIQKVENEVKNMEKAGYSIFHRNPEDSKYLIENSKEFYCTSNTIYIVYAYGNDTFTNEVDVVII